MSSYKLYTPHHVPHSRKVFVVAGYAGVTVEKIFTNYDQSKLPEFLKKNPNGKFPVLETPEGKYVYESNAIIRHLARLDKSKNLYGVPDTLEETLVDQWLDWTAGELVTPAYGFYLPYFGLFGNKESSQEAEKKLRPLLKILDDHFKVNTYLVGNQITIADINLAGYLFLAFKFLWEEKARKIIPNITRWYETVATQQPFIHEYGRFSLAVKSLEFPNIPQEEKKTEQKPAKAQKQEKQEKQEKPQPKKAEPKEEEEDQQAAEEKKKNPLDLLPPSTFNLFDFKTLFVNAPNKLDALDFFFKNYDAQGYSIYFIEYEKAEGEGEKVFLTNNLMNGFIQRLEHFRKYAFGVHGVYGEEPKLEIRGVWLWRGVGLPAEITDLDSYEYHKFTKLDLNNEADKKKVTEFWSKLNEDEDVVDGLRARTVKYFK